MSEAIAAPPAARSVLAGRARNERVAWAVPGNSHDRVIHVARTALPAAIGVLAAILALAPFTAGRDISFVLAKDQVAVAKERMRVSRAIYRGDDAKGRPFVLTAGSAVQVNSDDPVVRLEQLTAQIALAGGPARLVAGRGRYDLDSRRVAMDGPTEFTAADGYHIAMRDVLFDMDSRRLQSHRPVDGRTPLGTFTADRLATDLETRVVRLDGRVRLHIVQSQSRGRK